MKNKAIGILCGAALMALMPSCEHITFDTIDPDDLNVRIAVDWSRFDKETPTGMTLHAYHCPTGYHYNQSTNETGYFDVPLLEGSHSIFVFNQSEDEFAYTEFKDLDKYTTAKAVGANVADVRWEPSRANFVKERVTEAPDWIAVAHVDEIRVASYEARARSRARSRSRGEEEWADTIASVQPHNVTSDFDVRIKVDNFSCYLAARAYLDGMAEGVMLATSRPTEESTTVALNSWSSRTISGTDGYSGYIEAHASCFGLPDRPRTGPDDNILYLQIMLVDRKTVMEYELHCGEYFTVKDDGTKLTVTLTIELPNPLPSVEPADDGTGGAFDISVEDWGDEVEIHF